jgi:UDP-glucuronate 4-epimerase
VSSRKVAALKYLVTGAAGFIGSNLSARLAKSGNEVLGVDNFSPYYSPKFKELRVGEFLTPNGIEVKRIDLSDITDVEKIVRGFKPDVIIHLAAQPGVRTPLGKSYQYIQNNLVAFANVLQTAIEESIPEILYASSSSVYGNSTETTYKEDDLSIRPISIYGATKLANEILTPVVITGSRTRARGMRFFTVYGPWGRPDMAYFRIIDSILNGSEFKKFGGGEVKRDFTYVDDITETIESLSNELATRPAGFSDVVNIGGGSPHSLNDLINVISKQLGSAPIILESASNPNDVSFTCADVSRLNELIKGVPHINLESGVKETIAWAQRDGIKGHLGEWIDSTY